MRSFKAHKVTKAVHRQFALKLAASNQDRQAMNGVAIRGVLQPAQRVIAQCLEVSGRGNVYHFHLIAFGCVVCFHCQHTKRLYPLTQEKSAIILRLFANRIRQVTYN